MKNISRKIGVRIKTFMFNLKISMHKKRCFRYVIDSGDRFCLQDDEISRSLYIYDGFENINRRYWEGLIKSGMTVLDIGANWGVYSVSARRLVEDSGELYSFEPNKEEFNKLSKNMALNHRDINNVHLINSAVGDADGMTSFYIPPNYKGAYGSIGRPKIEEECIKVEVPVVQLDSYVKRNEIQKVDVIKVDVEGAEIKVLKGMRGTLEKFSPVILMEVSDKRTEVFGYKARELCDYLLELGYKLFLPRANEHDQIILDEYIPEKDIKYVDVVAIKNSK